MKKRALLLIYVVGIFMNCISVYAAFEMQTYTDNEGVAITYSVNGNMANIKEIYTNGKTKAVIPQDINGYTVKTVTADISGITELEILGGDVLTFKNKSDLQTVVLAGAMKKVPKQAFSGCSSLKNVTISENIERLEESCFSDCTALETITIPDMVEYIDAFAFKNCKNLSELTWSRNSELSNLNVFEGTKFADDFDNGCLLLKDGTELYKCGKNTKTLTIPETVKRINSRAFEDTDIEEVTFPSSLNNIDNEAFAGASNLKTVELKGEITQMGDCAFMNCTSLEQAVIPSGITSIPDGAFSGCTGIKTLEIPEHITKIGLDAFANTGIRELKIPNSITRVNGFADCKNLKSVDIPKSVTYIEGYSFCGCSDLEKLTVEGSTFIGGGAFTYTALTENNIHLADGVRYQGVIENTEYPSDSLVFLYPWHVATAATQKPSETPDAKSTETPKATDAPKETAEPNPSPTSEPSKLEVTGGEEIKISVDGKNVEFDAKPFIDGNDRTLVPIRAVSEMLDAKVDWDEQTQTVTISQDEKIVKIVIGSDTMTVDGNAVKMDTQAVISEERTYVPIRFAAEALGLTVNWVE